MSRKFITIYRFECPKTGDGLYASGVAGAISHYRGKGGRFDLWDDRRRPRPPEDFWRLVGSLPPWPDVRFGFASKRQMRSWLPASQQKAALARGLVLRTFKVPVTAVWKDAVQACFDSRHAVLVGTLQHPEGPTP